MRAIPGANANYRHLSATPDGVLYLSGQGKLALYNIEAKAEQTIVEGVNDYDLSADMKHIVFQARDQYGIAPLASGQKPDQGLLKLDGMTMKIEPKKNGRRSTLMRGASCAIGFITRTCTAWIGKRCAKNTARSRPSSPTAKI